jgi:hypothetical protein
MKHIIYILFVQVLLLTSCEKFIDLKPLDKISMDDYWKTTKDLEYYTMQFYPSFYNSDNSENILTEMVTQTATDSDDMIYEGYASNLLNGKRSRRTGTWRYEWNKIRNINIFIRIITITRKSVFRFHK